MRKALICHEIAVTVNYRNDGFKHPPATGIAPYRQRPARPYIHAKSLKQFPRFWVRLAVAGRGFLQKRRGAKNTGVGNF